MEEKEYQIPVEGSLGLLALGHIGLQLWRDKRAQAEIDPVSEETVSVIKTDISNSSTLYFEKDSN
jgi:hypothetical protein